MRARRSSTATRLALLLITALGLGLRLLAWHWHELYPLGGDEREYLNLALGLLRGEGYQDLPLMRPPLYPLLLAAWAWLVDSSTQGIRLIQALVSTATIPLIYLLARELALLAGSDDAGPRALRRMPLVAALLAALSYTLALNAAELLTETAFLFGLTLFLWLLLLARRHDAGAAALLAGLNLGALCLLRSVALPLLLLGAGFLLLRPLRSRRLAALLAVGALGVIALWTVRNALVYHSFILIDTTGQENLWLDNDPAGREAVKRQLYALGNDRGARARLAVGRGLDAITSDLPAFGAKAGRELERFFALEHVDDMRARPAIWVRPAERWLRLLLGDGLWLLLLLAGLVGLVSGRWRGAGLLLGLWCGYTLLTAMIFHVELRYRLPLYPALLPLAAWTLCGRPQGNAAAISPAGLGRLGLGLLVALGALTLTLWHAPYPTLGWQLARKHLRLTSADGALARGDLARARAQAEAALALDERSALARVVLAQAALREGDDASAERELRGGIAAVAEHPYAHLLLGDLLRRRKDPAARHELAYETASLEDLQRWSWDRFSTPPPERLEVGDGLDLGWLQGFYEARDGARWTTDRALLRLSPPAACAQRRCVLSLRVRAPRPRGAPAAELAVLLDGAQVHQATLSRDWQVLELSPGPAAGPLLVELRASTVRPHDYDRADPEGRPLGLQLDAAWVEAP